MSWMKNLIAFMGISLLLTTHILYAQEARPTPTNVPQTTQPDNGVRGTIRGAVYQDVNGDGRCLNTGIADEKPVANIPIEFVSSDEKTIITLYTGDNGTYGLAGAGISYWAVTAKPSADWIVTSKPTLYAPIFEDSLVQTDINFCVQKTSGNARVNAILPEAGRAASPILTIAALSSLLLIFSGLFLHHRQKRQQTTP